jgi:flagellar basal body-associated protein FliL
MLTKMNGLIGTVIGLILAIVGAFFWFSLGHHKLGPGLLVIGILILAFGIYAYMAGSKNAGAAPRS